MSYTNSPLICYTKISPNKNSPRNHKIDTITIHCMAGNLSVETCGNLFAAASRQASSNYGIGSDGRIALYVEEKDRSWASSNAANDNRAVTIEVANDGGASTGWHVSDKAMKSLIELVSDICRRNGIQELKWSADKSLAGQVDKQNMTVHRWFKNKACPGDYLYGKHFYIADEVNKNIGGGSAIAKPPQTADGLYRIRKSWTDVSSQLGAFSSLDRAKKAWKAGYYVFDANGNMVYPMPSNPFPSTPSTSDNANHRSYQVKLLDDLNIRKTPNGTILQTNGAKKGFVYTIVETQGTWGRLKSGAGWISVSSKYVRRV